MRFASTLAIALGLAGWAFALSLAHGPRSVDVATFFDALMHYDVSNDLHIIARDIRLPRAILGLLVGGCLATAGAVMQGVTRNPLASPTIMGLSSGGALAVLMAMIAIPALSYTGAMAASLVGATLGYGTVLAVSALSPGGFGAAKLALAGAVVSSLIAAVMQGLVIQYQMADDMLYWSVGGIATAGWPQVAVIAPFCLVGTLGAMAFASSITVLSLGNEAAIGLGQDTLRVRAGATFCVLLLASSAVAVAGPISFVGLMAPHVSRMLVGADYRRVIPLAFVIGAAVTEFADVAARSALGGWREVPLGVLTAVFGAPCFVWLVRQRLANRLDRGLSFASAKASRPWPWRPVVFALGGLLLVACWLRMQFGYIALSPDVIFSTLAGGGSPGNELVLWSFRVPRAIFAILAGAGIAISGVLFQAVLRNDLAEPGILGVSSGSNLAIVLTLATMSHGVLFSIWLLPAAAIAGAMLATLGVYLLSRGSGHSTVRLLLTGVAVSAALSALTVLIAMQLSERLYEFATAFTAGSLSTADWNYVGMLGLLLGLLVPWAWSSALTLDVLRTGDEPATGLGVDVQRKTLGLLALAVAICASCMSLSGGVMFLGLIAPHIARSLIGPSHRTLIPVAGLTGGLLLLLADVAGDTLFPMQLPAGVMVSALGAPYFLYLLTRS